MIPFGSNSWGVSECWLGWGEGEDPPEQVSPATVTEHPGLEDKAPLPAPTGLVAVIREFQRPQTQEGIVASFLTLLSPGVTQKWRITPSIVLTHTGPYCFPSAQRGGCDNGLEWHFTLLSPMLQLFFQFWNRLNNYFLRGVSAFHLDYPFFPSVLRPQVSGNACRAGFRGSWAC